MTANLEVVQDTQEDWEKAVHNYNIVAGEVGGSHVKVMTPDRVRKLKRLLCAVGGLEAWNEALANVEKSAFLRGELPPRQESSKPFKFNFSFILCEENFLKLWEGVYND